MIAIREHKREVLHFEPSVLREDGEVCIAHGLKEAKEVYVMLATAPPLTKKVDWFITYITAKLRNRHYCYMTKLEWSTGAISMLVESDS